MKTALYARVSTRDQNCELQLSELRNYCAARTWEIHREYVDAGISGKSVKGRKEFQQLMKDAMARKIDCVVVTKLDRFGRSVIDLTQSIQQLDCAGVRFVAINQGIDTDVSNPVSRLTLNVLVAMAEFERSLINERVTVGAKAYQHDYAKGLVGKERYSKSGKNLPIGRPKVIFDRQKVLRMKAEGASIREISSALGLSIGTVARCSKNMKENAAWIG